MHHGSIEIRDVDNDPSMSHFDTSTLPAASEDNMLRTREIQGRKSEDDSDNDDQAEDDDAEYERVAPFRHALIQHLTSSDSNPYSFNQLANNPTLLVDLVQSFNEQNSKVVYDCFMANDVSLSRTPKGYSYLDPELWFPMDGVHSPVVPDKNKAYARWRTFLCDLYLLVASDEANKLTPDNAGG
ncbi:hypothetical protein LTR27_008478 [Elasticomyces elasticus]|nr:hypothetical protein LTR27_008478 [Elasticomyces elasticus]